MSMYKDKCYYAKFGNCMSVKVYVSTCKCSKQDKSEAEMKYTEGIKYGVEQTTIKNGHSGPRL